MSSFCIVVILTLINHCIFGYKNDCKREWKSIFQRGMEVNIFIRYFNKVHLLTFCDSCERICEFATGVLPASETRNSFLLKKHLVLVFKNKGEKLKNLSLIFFVFISMDLRVLVALNYVTFHVLNLLVDKCVLVGVCYKRKTYEVFLFLNFLELEQLFFGVSYKDFTTLFDNESSSSCL